MPAAATASHLLDVVVIIHNVVHVQHALVIQGEVEVGARLAQRHDVPAHAWARMSERKRIR
jgi:hypothetical protein